MSKNLLVYVVILLIFHLIIFILPANQIFPNGHQVLSAVEKLYQDYHLLFNLLYTLTNVMLVIIVSLILLVLLLNNSSVRKFLIKKIKFEKFVLPFIFLIFLFNHWFVSFEYAPLLIATIFYLPYLLKKTIDGIELIPKNYFDAAKSLFIEKDKAESKLLSPRINSLSLFEVYKSLNFVWSIIIFCEFLSPFEKGLGYLLKITFQYWSIEYLISLSLISLLSITLLKAFFHYIEKKFYPWEN
ncbi:MAG: hypothetical protein C0425_09725 [Chlorobiaceae bacterium]|nr:hypothetical protein [Chlorobiaceae bacterium]MBA4310596.1 hypothetical protein [Chlorobiaceae bacterium]